MNTSKPKLSRLSAFKPWKALPPVAVAVILGYVVVRIFAAGPAAVFLPPNGTITGNASVQTQPNAIGGRMLVFGVTPAPTPTPTPTPTPGGGGSCPSGTKNTPDGADPWGGCWPGPATTGYPHGLSGDTRAPVTLSNYTGSCTITSAVTITGKIFNCDVVIQAKVTIINSLINGQIVIDSDNPATSHNLNWFLTLQDSEVNTGLVELPAVYEGAISMLRDNIHGGVTAVQCGDKAAQCVIHDTYLHGQLIQVNSNWHLGGFHSIGGTNYDLTHNYVTCDQPATYGSDGGCSGDIVFIPTPPDLISHALINKNFMGGNPAGAYCLYGGDRPPDSFATYMTITNNVWARGTTGNCDAYGPVAGTSTGPTNVWSGNVWENGGAINPEE